MRDAGTGVESDIVGSSRTSPRVMRRRKERDVWELKYVARSGEMDGIRILMPLQFGAWK